MYPASFIKSKLQLFIMWNCPSAVTILQVFILNNLTKSHNIQTQKWVSTDMGTFLKQQAIISLIHYMWHIRKPCLEITGLPPLRTAWLHSSEDSDQSLNSLILFLEGNKIYSRRNSIVKTLSSVLFKGKSSTIKISGRLSQDESSVVCTQKIWVISWTS